MLLTEPLPIAPGDTTGTLHDKLATLGAQLIVHAIELAARGALRPVPQPQAGVTYAHKIEKSEASIDWAQPAEVIERRLRAFDPFPGASSVLAGETLKIWRGRLEHGLTGAAPGTVLGADASGIVVACGRGALRLTQVQRAGGRRLSVAEFLRGLPVAPGAVFEARA